jgi:CheY-like chemotaxis protein
MPMTSPEEAIKEVLRTPPDILIVEIGISEMDGFSLLEQLRTRGMKESVRVVFMSKQSDPAERQRAQDLGAFEVIRKPFDPDEILRRVESLAAGGGAAVLGSDALAPLNHHLLAAFEAGWRLSLPEEILSSRHTEQSTVEELLNAATAKVSGRARDRGVDLHVQGGPSAVLRGNRELLIRAWAQLLEASVMRAEPGSAVSVQIESGTRGLKLRLGVSCTSTVAARMEQLAGAGASPVRVERRPSGGVDIVVDIQSGA